MPNVFGVGNCNHRAQLAVHVQQQVGASVLAARAGQGAGVQLLRGRARRQEQETTLARQAGITEAVPLFDGTCAPRSCSQPRARSRRGKGLWVARGGIPMGQVGMAPAWHGCTASRAMPRIWLAPAACSLALTQGPGPGSY